MAELLRKKIHKLKSQHIKQSLITQFDLWNNQQGHICKKNLNLDVSWLMENNRLPGGDLSLKVVGSYACKGLWPEGIA